MNIFDIDKVVNMLIRPNRQYYQISDLQNLTPKKCKRQDFFLALGDQYIVGSIISKKEPLDRVVLYLHSNAGSRLQGLAYAEKLLCENLALVVFDFVGCGLSSGDYITLGRRQVDCAERVIKYLIERNSQMKIAVWGRSMGAVTTLRLSKFKQIVCIVADSAFANLQELALSLGNKISMIPQFILSIYMLIIKSKVKDIAGFQLSDIDTLNKGFYAALFLSCKEDNLVPFEQMKRVFDTYKGEKELFQISTNHNQKRNDLTIKRVIKFISTNLQVADMKKRRRSQQLITKQVINLRHSTVRHYHITDFDIQKRNTITIVSRNQQQNSRKNLIKLKQSLIENPEHQMEKFYLQRIKTLNHNRAKAPYEYSHSQRMQISQII